MDKLDSALSADCPVTAAWNDETQGLRLSRRKRRGWITTPRRLLERGSFDRAAVASLCATYRVPVRDFLRQRGVPSEQAEDVTQGLFERLLARHELSRLKFEGSFGAWLRTAAMHHLYNERAKQRTAKRSLGAAQAAELRAQLEERQEPAADRLLDRERALLLVERAWARLGREYERQGAGVLFDHLKKSLSREATPRTDAELGQALGYCESYVAAARCRMKKEEFPAALLAELNGSRPDPGGAPLSLKAPAVREELRALLDALS